MVRVWMRTVYVYIYTSIITVVPNPKGLILLNLKIPPHINQQSFNIYLSPVHYEAYHCNWKCMCAYVHNSIRSRKPDKNICQPPVLAVNNHVSFYTLIIPSSQYYSPCSGPQMRITVCTQSFERISTCRCPTFMSALIKYLINLLTRTTYVIS